MDKRLLRFLEENEILRQLQILRIDSGRTEEDIANILGWTEEQVLAFEMSEIQNVHFRDLLAYINAIDIRMDIRLREKDAPVSDHIAFHTSKLYDLFRELVEKAGKDPRRTKEAVELIYLHNKLFTNMAMNLTTHFPNKNAVMETLIKMGIIYKTAE